LDWSNQNKSGPITSPLWSILNQYAGAWFFFWVLTPILWSMNAFKIDKQLGSAPGQGPNGTGDFPLGLASKFNPKCLKREFFKCTYYI
jgi:hypothetical protein